MSTTYTDYPYRFSSGGRTASTAYAEHVRDLIEQVLFTRPGERVMRPLFGCGIDRLLFGPGGPELAEQTNLIISAALQEWLADVMEVLSLDVRFDDSQLLITVVYRILASGEQREDQFVREGTG